MGHLNPVTWHEVSLRSSWLNEIFAWTNQELQASPKKSFHICIFWINRNQYKSIRSLTSFFCFSLEFPTTPSSPAWSSKCSQIDRKFTSTALQVCPLQSPPANNSTVYLCFYVYLVLSSPGIQCFCALSPSISQNPLESVRIHCNSFIPFCSRPVKDESVVFVHFEHPPGNGSVQQGKKSFCIQAFKDAKVLVRTCHTNVDVRDFCVDASGCCFLDCFGLVLEVIVGILWHLGTSLTCTQWRVPPCETSKRNCETKHNGNFERLWAFPVLVDANSKLFLNIFTAWIWCGL